MGKKFSETVPRPATAIEAMRERAREHAYRIRERRDVIARRYGGAALVADFGNAWHGAPPVYDTGRTDRGQPVVVVATRQLFRRFCRGQS